LDNLKKPLSPLLKKKTDSKKNLLQGNSDNRIQILKSNNPIMAFGRGRPTLMQKKNNAGVVEGQAKHLVSAEKDPYLNNQEAQAFKNKTENYRN
jgi:hypothetical protein